MTEYLLTHEAAERLKLSPRTLERMRLESRGPRYRKAGRRVLYLVSDLDDWLAERSFENTAQAKSAGIR